MTTSRQPVEAIKRGTRWFADRPPAIYAAIWGLYLIGRVVQVAGGQVFQSWDSAVYAYRVEPERNKGPLVSFIGHAPRPWGLPLFYAMFPTDEWRAVGQWAFATLVWAFFAWETSRHLRTRAARYAVLAAILFFALLNNVTNWDFAILTESTSVSIGVLVLALLLRWLRTGSWASIVGLMAAATWWTFIRPDIRVFTVVLIAVFVTYAARLWWRRRSAGAADAGGAGDTDGTAGSRRTAVSRGATGPLGAAAGGAAPEEPARARRLIAAALAACVVLGLGIAWYAAITPAMDKAFAPYDDDQIPSHPLPLNEYLFVYRLRVDASTDPEVWRAFKTELGMPTCPDVEAFTATSDWQAEKFAEAYTRCPPMVAWVAERKDQLFPFWTGLLAADPGLAVRKFLKMTSLDLGGDVYAHVPQVVPAPIEKLVFPSRRYGLPLALIGFGVALALAWRAGAWRHDRRLVTFAVVLFGTALLSAAATIAEHTGEIQRYGVQETFATRISIIVLLATALDAWLLRRRRQPASADAGAPAEVPMRASRG